MRRLRLDASAAVDNPDPGHGAGVVVGRKDLPPERSVADLPVDEDLLDASFGGAGSDQRCRGRVELRRLKVEVPRFGRVQRRCQTR